MTKIGSLASALRTLSALASQLLGTELALLKAETSENVGAVVAIALYAVVAVFSGLVGLIFLFLALGFLLMKLGLELWLSWLVIAAVWFITAAACAIIVKSRLHFATLFPERTVSQLKADVAALQRGLTHG